MKAAALAGLSLFLALAAATAGCRDVAAQRARSLERATLAEAAGDFEDAARILGEALARDPRDATVRRALASHWLTRGRPDAARRVLEALPEDVPRDPETEELLARISLGDATLREAVRALRFLDERGRLEAADRDALVERWIAGREGPRVLAPLSPALRERAVTRLIETGDLTRALAAWRELAAREAHGPELLETLIGAALRRDDGALLEALEPELREERTPRASLAFHRVLVGRGDWARAEQVERSFLERHPTHPGRYGIVLAGARRESRSGSPQEGLRLAQEAARLRPDRAEAFVEQAIALDAQGRAAEARRAAAAALRAEPDDALAQRVAAELEPRAPAGTEHHFTLELR